MMVSGQDFGRGDKMEIRVREAVIPKGKANFLASLMSPTQIAEKLGRGWYIKKVRRLIYSGALPSVKVCGRFYVRRQDFENYVQEQGLGV
jgi:hypothetical protein